MTDQVLTEEDTLSEAERLAVASAWVARDYDKSHNLKQKLLLPWDGPGEMPKLGDAFSPGPTGTNVGDVAFVLAPGGDVEPGEAAEAP